METSFLGRKDIFVTYAVTKLTARGYLTENTLSSEPEKKIIIAEEVNGHKRVI